MGSDMLLSFDSWHRWQEILRLALSLIHISALRQTNDFVLSQGKPLDPMSKAAYDEIKAEVDARAAKAG